MNGHWCFFRGSPRSFFFSLFLCVSSVVLVLVVLILFEILLLVVLQCSFKCFFFRCLHVLLTLVLGFFSSLLVGCIAILPSSLTKSVSLFSTLFPCVYHLSSCFYASLVRYLTDDRDTRDAFFVPLVTAFFACQDLENVLMFYPFLHINSESINGPLSRISSLCLPLFLQTAQSVNRVRVKV